MAQKFEVPTSTALFCEEKAQSHHSTQPLMKILCVIVLRLHSPKPVLLSSTWNLDSFGILQRSGIREVCTFAARLVVSFACVTPSRQLSARTEPNKMRSVKWKEDYMVHVKVTQRGLALVAVCDQDYPQASAFRFLKEAQEIFTQQHQENKWRYGNSCWPANRIFSGISSDSDLETTNLDPTMRAYSNDPNVKDKIKKIAEEIEDTRQIVAEDISKGKILGISIYFCFSPRSNVLKFLQKIHR